MAHGDIQAQRFRWWHCGTSFSLFLHRKMSGCDFWAEASPERKHSACPGPLPRGRRDLGTSLKIINTSDRMLASSASHQKEKSWHYHVKQCQVPCRGSFQGSPQPHSNALDRWYLFIVMTTARKHYPCDKAVRVAKALGLNVTVIICRITTCASCLFMVTIRRHHAKPFTLFFTIQAPLWQMRKC